MLQDEIHEIPFVLDLINGNKYEMQFLAGFVGLSQDEKTGSIKPEIGWFIQEKKMVPVHVPTWLYEKTKISGVIIEDYEKRICYQKLLIETEKLIFSPYLLQSPQLTKTRRHWQSSVINYTPLTSLLKIKSVLSNDINEAKLMIKEKIYIAKKIEINIQMLCRILSDPKSFNCDDFNMLTNDDNVVVDMNVIEKEMANPNNFLFHLEKNKWLSEIIPQNETTVIYSKTKMAVNKVQPKTSVTKQQSNAIKAKPPTTIRK